MPVRIKVCCIADEAEAALAVRYGASALGLISEMPSGPGVIDEAAIARIVAGVPAGVGTFLLTSRTDPEAIVRQQRRTGANTLQLCDRMAPGAMERLRAELPGVALVRVVHVVDERAIEEAREAAALADAILLDSGNPDLGTKELGGTGRRHDWTISRRIREAVAAPVYLAGGLKPENAAEAIAMVQPYGLDLCSGIRTDGKLDERKLAAFCRAVEAAG